MSSEGENLEDAPASAERKESAVMSSEGENLKESPASPEKKESALRKVGQKSYSKLNLKGRKVSNNFRTNSAFQSCL